jgi:hypothetical protein
MEFHFWMGRMRFNHSKDGLLAADWTGFVDDALNPHVTSFRPTCRVKAMDRPNGSHKGGIEPGHLAMAARSIPSCSFNVTVSRRLKEA